MCIVIILICNEFLYCKKKVYLWLSRILPNMSKAISFLSPQVIVQNNNNKNKQTNKQTQTNKRSKIKTRQILNTNENQVPGFRQAHLRCWATGMDYSHFCFSMGIYVVRSFVVLFLIACVIILYYGKMFKQCLSTQTIPNLYVTFNIVKFVKKKSPLFRFTIIWLVCVCVCDWVFVCVFLVKNKTKQNKTKKQIQSSQDGKSSLWHPTQKSKHINWIFWS